MTPARQAASWLLFLAAFALGSWATATGVMQLTRALGAEPGQNPLEAVRFVQSRLETLQTGRAAGARPRIAYLGDSTVAAHQGGESLPELLQGALGDEARVFDVSFPAMGMTDFYLLSDPIAKSRPDLIVWQTSFTHLGSWEFSAQRRGLSGWLGWESLPGALALPIEKISLTADQLLLYLGIVEAGGFDAWYRLGQEQSRVVALRGVAEAKLARWTGARPEQRFRTSAGFNHQAMSSYAWEGRRRYFAEREFAHFGDALTGLEPDHLALQALCHGLERFTAYDIPVVVYSNPVNIDNLTAVEIQWQAAFRASDAVLRGVVEGCGGSMLSFYALFPDTAFRDAAGHFSASGAEDRRDELIAGLAAGVRQRLAEHAEN